MKFLLGLIVLVLDVIVIAKVLTGPYSGGYKALWTIIILLLPVIGLLLYLILGRTTATA